MKKIEKKNGWLMSVKRNRKIIDRYDNFNVETLFIDKNGEDLIYNIVRRKECVIIIAEIYNKLIMVDEYRIAINKSLLQFPAGKIESWESPEAAAKREMLEETGYKVEKIDKIGFFYSSPQFSDEIFHLFYAKVSENGLPNLTSHEVISPSLISSSVINTMINKGQICDAKTITAYTLWRQKNEQV